MKLSQKRKALLMAFATYVRSFKRSDTTSLREAITELREEDDRLYGELSSRTRPAIHAATEGKFTTPNSDVLDAWANEAFKMAAEQ